VSGTRSTASPSSSTSSSASAASAERARRRLRRLAPAAGLLAAALIAALLLARGGGATDPLARVVPPDALGWAHVSTAADAGALWEIPALRDAPGRLAGAFGLSASRLDLGRDVRPWVGEQAGLAWLPDGAALLLAQVADRGRADAALRRLGARPAGGGRYALPAPGTAAGIAGGVLAAGPEAAVRAALARAGGTGRGLDSTAAYAHAIEGREDAVLGVYAPAAGVQRLAASTVPLLRLGAALLGSAGLDGVAAEAAPARGGVEVRARVLRRPGAAAPATFAPGLLGRVPEPGTAALLDLPGAAALQAIAARLGAAGAVTAAQAAIGDAAGIDLERDVIAPLRGEAALSLQGRGAVPVLTLAARTAGPATTRAALARLRAPLAARLTGGAAGGFEAREDGSFTLPVTARLQPSYGLGGSVLVASSAQPGLDQLRAAPRGIAQAPAFARVLARMDGAVQALGFFDLQALFDLGERTGLAAGSSFGAVRADLDPIEAVGAVVSQESDHPTDTTAELFLQIP
jgi:hypothetical protein